MCDLISRQAAIEALARTAREKFNLSDEFSHYLAGLMDGENAIRQLPSAHPLDPCETCLHKGKGWYEDPCDGCTGTESKYEPDNGWIPASERLPVYGEKCLVDFKLISGTSHCISTSYCYVQKEGFWSDTPFQYKAIAWMPLPDPYKEEE